MQEGSTGNRHSRANYVAKAHEVKNGELLSEHFCYIRKMVRRSRHLRHWDKSEIVGVVMLHMVAESQRFDPSKGTFKSFLSTRIPGRIVDAIRSVRFGGRIHLERVEMPDRSVEDAPICADVLGNTMAELPERWRRILEMRFRDDQTCEDIAHELGVSTWTVVQTTRKALAEMRRLLEARGVHKTADVL